jgi:hypothetical protein
MRGHGTPHGAEADEADIDHCHTPIFISLFRSGIERQRRVTSETIDRRGPRLVPAPDPAAITNSVGRPEQEGAEDPHRHIDRSYPCHVIAPARWLAPAAIIATAGGDFNADDPVSRDVVETDEKQDKSTG